MTIFSSLTKDVVFILKAGGERTGPHKAALSGDGCTIFDRMLDVDHGDTVARLLPNGKEEHYLILLAHYQEGLGSIPAAYKLKLRKDQQIHEAPSHVLHNIKISHSTGVQIGSYNTQNIQNAFVALEKAIDAQVAPAEDKADAKSKLRALLRHPLVVAVLGGVAGGLAE